jgi:nucleoid-associated protein YgaU
MHSSVRSGSVLFLILGLASPLAAQSTPATVLAPAPVPSPAPAEKSPESSAEAKLAVALRSYALLDAELDKVRSANAELTTEKNLLETKFAADKALLETRLAETQAAIPVAAQAVALREQLRQTQAQMAAYAEENAQLKNRLALGASASSHAPSTMAPTPPAATPAPATPPPAPKPATRTHTIVMGDTLVKISQTYYGTPNRWNDILAANRDALRDEKSLVIGRTLVIP